MPIKDILLPLISYPAVTGLTAIENAMQLAGELEAKLSAITCHMELAPFAGMFIEAGHAKDIVDTERERNHRLAGEAIANFERVANRAAVVHEHIIARCAPAEYPRRLVREAQLRDFAMLAIGGKGAEQGLAEALIFESGRPVVIFPEEPRRELTASMRNIALAWDFTGPSTRAITDAFPLLERASNLRILTVTDDKAIDRPLSSTTLGDRLAKHGFKAVLDEIRSKGAPIGEVFTNYVAEQKIDLLVMGAYGHSKFRELVLGGATKSIVESPPTWVLLSR